MSFEPKRIRLSWSDFEKDFFLASFLVFAEITDVEDVYEIDAIIFNRKLYYEYELKQFLEEASQNPFIKHVDLVIFSTEILVGHSLHRSFEPK